MPTERWYNATVIPTHTMRNCLHKSSPRHSRAAAWLLAALCLWMGTGGVLHHTDTGQGVAGSSSPLTTWGQATTAAAPDDGCAACQWTQGLQGGPPAVIHFTLPLSFTAPRACHLPDKLLSRLPLRRSSRGPPALLS